jgi:hypothetical protein
VSWIAWHLLLNATHATEFDVDAPIIALSWEDVGSGVGARTEPNIGKLLERYEWLTEKVVTEGWNEATVLAMARPRLG